MLTVLLNSLTRDSLRTLYLEEEREAADTIRVALEVWSLALDLQIPGGQELERLNSPAGPLGRPSSPKAPFSEDPGLTPVSCHQKSDRHTA